MPPRADRVGFTPTPKAGVGDGARGAFAIRHEQDGSGTLTDIRFGVGIAGVCEFLPLLGQ
jgi:hypothetical protein